MALKASSISCKIMFDDIMLHYIVLRNSILYLLFSIILYCIFEG